MDDQRRPRSREKKVVSEGKGVEKKGQGLGTGPVNNAGNYEDRKQQYSAPSSSYSGSQQLPQQGIHYGQQRPQQGQGSAFGQQRPQQGRAAPSGSSIPGRNRAAWDSPSDRAADSSPDSSRVPSANDRHSAPRILPEAVRGRLEVPLPTVRETGRNSITAPSDRTAQGRVPPDPERAAES